MKRWLVILTLSLLGLNASAALMWERLRADLAPGVTEKSIETSFPFVNEGPDAVTIESIKSSCGCTTTALDKKTYAPGEKGELRARFDIGQRRGQQTKTVAVKIQGERAPTILTLAVIISDPMKATPGLLSWEKGEKNTSKEMVISAQPGQPIRVLRVISANPRMQARVVTIKEGHDYVVRVTPENTEVAGFTVLTIDAELEGGKTSLRAYAQVKPKVP